MEEISTFCPSLPSAVVVELGDDLATRVALIIVATNPARYFALIGIFMKASEPGILSFKVRLISHSDNIGQASLEETFLASLGVLECILYLDLYSLHDHGSKT